MADAKLSALTELSTTPAVDDELYICDVSEDAASESKKITVANLISRTGRTVNYVLAASDATVNEKLQADSTCDGTADNVDITAAIAAVNATSGGIVKLTGGTFVIAASVTPLSNVTLELSPNTILDKSAAGADVVIDGGGSLDGTATADLASNGVLKDTHIHVDNDPAIFAAGDLVLITSTAVWKSNEFPGGPVFAGEMHYIGAVDATTLTFLTEETLYDSYATTATAHVRKINPIINFRVIGHGGIIRGKSNQADMGIRLAYPVNCEVEGLHFQQIDGYGCVDFANAWGGSIHNNYVDLAINTTSSYGMVVGNASQDVEIYGNTQVRGRHSVGVGASLGYTGIPRNINIHDNHSSDSQVCAFECHQTGENINIYNNTVISCAMGISANQFSGRVQGNTILNPTSYGIYSENPHSLFGVDVNDNIITNGKVQGIVWKTSYSKLSRNRLIDTTTAGIELWQCDACQVEDNVIIRTNSTQGQYIWVVTGTGHHIKRNRGFGTATNGLTIDSGVTGAVVEGNDMSTATTPYVINDASTIVKDIDDTPVNGEVNAPISSNWAYDHAALTTTAHGIANYLPLAGGELSGVVTTTEHSAIQLQPTLATDHHWNGITRSCEAGEDLAIGEVAYLKSDSLWYKVKGDAYATTAGQLVLVTSTVDQSVEATFIGLLIGYFYDATFDLTVGGEVWISKATAGLITKTQPTTPAFLKCIGYGDDDADTIYFNPSSVIVEI